MGNLAFIPARVGSVSIPNKNMADLGGYPLIGWCLDACVKSPLVDNIVVSTDMLSVIEHCDRGGIDVDVRPPSLCGPDVNVADVLYEYIQRTDSNVEFIYLVQPTSPFLRQRDIASIHDAINTYHWMTAHTVCKTPHNFHPYNQRVGRGDGSSEFLFPEQRYSQYNKQRKEVVYSFGNLIAIKPEHFMENRNFWAQSSAGIEITWPYSLDVDTPNDLYMANLIVQDKGHDVDNWEF